MSLRELSRVGSGGKNPAKNLGYNSHHAKKVHPLSGPAVRTNCVGTNANQEHSVRARGGARRSRARLGAGLVYGTYQAAQRRLDIPHLD